MAGAMGQQWTVYILKVFENAVRDLKPPVMNQQEQELSSMNDSQFS